MSDRREWGPAFALFTLLLAVYLLTFSGRYHASDEISMLVATDSLARRGAWDTDLIRWMGEQQGSFGPDGHLYSRKGIGTTLAALPLYWPALRSQVVGNVQAAMLTNSLVTALTAVFVYLAARRLRYGRGVAGITALTFGLATMAWPYARYLFSEPLAALGVMAGAYFLLRYRDRGDGWSLLLAGTALGAALLSRLNNAIVAPFLGLALLAYLIRRLGSPRTAWRRWLASIAVFGLPVLAALAVTAWYNWLRFGSPLVTGYLPEERFSAPVLQGLYGLLLSPGKGLLWYNPIFFASLLAWPAFIRRHRIEGWLALAIVAANVLFYAPWYLWWGGHAWGPRFLVAALPFAALPLAEALEAARRRRLLAAPLAVLALVSVGVQALGVAVNFNLYLEDVYRDLGLYHPATLFDPAYSPLLRQIAYVRLGNLDLAWARGGTIDGPALALGLACLAVALLVPAGATLALRKRRWAAPAAWAQIAALGLIGLATWLLLLPRYAPAGDLAEAAAALSTMEQPGERAMLADPLLTEPFQDAYDGRLSLWGDASSPPDGQAAGTWTVGGDGTKPAALRMQLGSVRLALEAPETGSGRLRRLPRLAAMSERLDSQVELTGSARETGAAAGQALRVMLAWQATAPMTASYTIFVQVIDGQGFKAGQVDRMPCGGSCPTSTWRPGDVVAERLDVPIRADAPPGRYQLIAGLYDLATGSRLPVVDGQGRASGDYVSLGWVQVESATAAR